MKKVVLLLLAALIMLSGTGSFACVGKTLIIGSLSEPNDRLLAQMMAVIINERTGTTVNVEYYDSQDKLYEAVKKKEVNILSENTGRAARLLQIEAAGDADAIYSTVKKEYKEKLQLVMLKPFGISPVSSGDEVFQDVPVIDAEILVDYPALPRVLNKLAGIMQKRNYPKLVASVESGDKPNQVARDFLKKKRLI
jgi:glycine betaine/choline ABC-type transport system substrate-binding protein